MPRRRESVGKALRRALGEEVVLPKIEPRKPGVSHLMNERRLRIYEAVFNNPGIHLRALQRLLRIPFQSLRWHVSVLVSSGLIQKASARKSVSLFAPISAGAAEAALMAASRDERFAPILEAIKGRGEASVSDITKAVGSYQQLVSSRLKSLREAGLVESVGGGRRKRYRLSLSASGKPAEGVADVKGQRESIVSLLNSQGLVVRVLSQSGGILKVTVDKGIDEVELEFVLRE